MSDKPQSEAGGDISSQIKFSVIDWQRRMFFASEPEVPSMEEQKAVYDIVATSVEKNGGHWCDKDWDVPMDLAIEAFRRGKQVSR
jgi:hypothetical protein